MKRNPYAAIAALVAAVAVSTVAVPVGAADWPQFRGNNRDGVSTETGLLDEWGETGPAEVWRVQIGEGFSAPSVVGDRIYTMYAAEVDEKTVEVAAAFDASTGKELWKTVIGEKLDTEFGNGPRSTPTVAGDLVYVLGSHGHFAALDRDSGEAKWKLSLQESFGSSLPTFGFSTSALVDGDRVLVEAGGPEGKSYAALDAASGEVIWTTGDATGPGYNSPIAVEMNGERRYVYIAGGVLRCIDEDGNEVWQHEWPQGETHAMPIRVGTNRIYASGAQGVGAQMVEVTENEEGGSVTEVWKEPNLRNHFSTSVVHEGFIYGFDNATLKAVNVDTGEMAWGKRGLGKGSLIFADGDLLVLSDRGVLLKVAANADGYTELGRVQALEGRTWTAPALANGILYLRGQSEMVAYDLRDGGAG